MGLRKELKSLRTELHNHEYVDAVAWDVKYKKLESHIEKLEAGVKSIDRDLNFSQHEHPALANAVTCLEKRLYDLSDQVQCGAVGHKLELRDTIIDCRCTPPKIRGSFRCCACNIAVSRDLTSKEVTAAKLLGYIRP